MHNKHNAFSLHSINKFMNADIIECELCDKRFHGMAALVEHPCRDDNLDEYKNYTDNSSKRTTI